MAAIVGIRQGFRHSKKCLGFTKLLLSDDNYLSLHRPLYMLRNNGMQIYKHVKCCMKLITSGGRKALSQPESRLPRFMTNDREYVYWKSNISIPLEKAFSGECWSTQSKHQISNNTSESFDTICEETLESLANCFEDLIGNHLNVTDTDVILSDGVLTVNLGADNGIYVINKQGPNQQIWLSSPTSGPKRYDFIENQWIYRRDGNSLHQLLTKEITEALHTDVDFTQCIYGKQ